MFLLKCLLVVQYVICSVGFTLTISLQYRIYIIVGLVLTIFFPVNYCKVGRRDDLGYVTALYQVGLFTLHYITLEPPSDVREKEGKHRD